MSFCPKCGKETLPSASFCVACGTSLEVFSVGSPTISGRTVTSAVNSTQVEDPEDKSGVIKAEPTDFLSPGEFPRAKAKAAGKEWSDKNKWIGLGSTMGVSLLIMSPAFFTSDGSTVLLLVLSSIAGAGILLGLPFLILFRKNSLGNSIFIAWCLGIIGVIFQIINDKYMLPSISNNFAKSILLLLIPALPSLLALAVRGRIQKIEDQKKSSGQINAQDSVIPQVMPSPVVPILQPGYSPCPSCGVAVNDQSVKCWSCSARLREI